MTLPHAAMNSNGLSFKEVAPQKLYNETLLTLAYTYVVHSDWRALARLVSAAIFE